VGKPETITRGSNTIGFAHDSEHQRFKQLAATGETLYLNAGGGKFGNGAVTAAFGYLFNELGNSEEQGYEETRYGDLICNGPAPGCAPIDMSDPLEWSDPIALGVVVGRTIVSLYRLFGEVGQLLPDYVFSSKAPYQVTPGTRTLQGRYINDRGRVEPWEAHYDQYGRLTGRTDFNAGNKAQGIPPTHHHRFQWGRGMTPKSTADHVPGPYVP
jgi:hypothetical protein